MGEDTRIKWTDSTFNPVIGCTKVGPGCDNCYAAALDHARFSRTLDGGSKEIPLTHWGPGAPRHRTKTWGDPVRWNRLAAARGKPWRVFCASMADVFDNEWPAGVHAELFALIEATPHLRWQLLTKRIGRWRDVVPHGWRAGFPAHVALGATIVNQVEAERDIPKLFAAPATTHFVSYEPALEGVDWRWWLDIAWSPALRKWKRLGGVGGEKLDWVIVGGESGANARIFRASWARSTVQQCRAAGVPVFVKQMGAFVVDRNDAGFDGCDEGSWPLRADGCDPVVEFDIHGHREEYQGADCRIRLADRAGADPLEWPEDLRVQQFPEALS